ncbi:MAG TPA: excinuclease ABC subunit UvrA, partial [Blastocatellia bacterium]|nr:excinuclease ABC subunit UvrA [Blastocatellia bacterium]
MAIDKIRIRGARQHNLKNIDLDIPRDSLTVVTGLSGSGKSSLAFDTVYAEGQRRYVESLSAYARQFLDQLEKPDVDSIEGLSPAISIEQKTISRSPRSTVGTVTEIYDYLRLLFSSIGLPHCPQCDRPITRQSIDQIVSSIRDLPEGERVMILAPIVRGRKGEFKKELEKLARAGFERARIDGEVRFLDEEISLDKRRNHSIELVVDRLLVRPGVVQRLEESVRTAAKLTGGLVLVSIIDGDERLYSERQACAECGISIPALEPRSFSFNSSYGACSGCKGIGTTYEVDIVKLLPDESIPINALDLAPFDRGINGFLRGVLKTIAASHKLPETTPFEAFPPKARDAFLKGTSEKLKLKHGSFAFTTAWPGASAYLKQQRAETKNEKAAEGIEALMSPVVCSACSGQRLRRESVAVRVNGLSIADYTSMPIDHAVTAFASITLNDREQQIAGLVLREIRDRLAFLQRVGLGYLALDRGSATLSGGEGQRIRLATQIGSQLRGVLYVLDEPSIGLHPRDNIKLINTLEELRNLGNTVLVVEHDEETIRRADHVVDLGPGAGLHGGKVVAVGTPTEVAGNPGSVTGRYLSGADEIAIPRQRRPRNGKVITVGGARANNLKNIDVEFPLGCFIAVTGVSGSGKSTLINEILYRSMARKLYRSAVTPGEHRDLTGLELIDKVIEIDQSPIGRTPRSNPSTYTGLFAPIRELYAQLPESRERGYKPGRFSFNVKGGRCEACQGDGVIAIEMHFLPDVYVTCEQCKGRRYNRETLDITYRGKSIADVLELTVDQAVPLLENFPAIAVKLRTL